MVQVTEFDEMRDALSRANRLINWMAEYLGGMAPPPDGIIDLNEHWLLMERMGMADPPRAPTERPINQRGEF